MIDTKNEIIFYLMIYGFFICSFSGIAVLFGIHLKEGCSLRYECDYNVTDARNGCIVTIKNTNYTCEYYGIACPDKKTSCYLSRGDSCPLIGSCRNQKNLTSFTTLILLIFLTILLFLIHSLFLLRESFRQRSTYVMA